MEYSDTPWEMNVMIANSELSIATGNMKKALSILQSVEKDSPYYIKSKLILANVFLNQLKDRRLYAKQYADIVADYPTFVNYKNLGNALLEIQEPEDAIKAF